VQSSEGAIWFLAPSPLRSRFTPTTRRGNTLQIKPRSGQVPAAWAKHWQSGRGSGRLIAKKSLCSALLLASSSSTTIERNRNGTPTAPRHGNKSAELGGTDRPTDQPSEGTDSHDRFRPFFPRPAPVWIAVAGDPCARSRRRETGGGKKKDAAHKKDGGRFILRYLSPADGREERGGGTGSDVPDELRPPLPSFGGRGEERGVAWMVWLVAGE
jgi:hypothetical protein